MDENASISRLARMADGLHEPSVAENAATLRERLVLIQTEAATLIALLDARMADRPS
jgi:hypothetical protein